VVYTHPVCTHARMRVGSGSGSVFAMRDVLLRDGSTLHLEAPRPVDFREIKAFYDGLSWESRYFRFCGYPRTDLAARAEADASGVDRVTLIGRHSGRVVASARYDVLREKGAAEVTFAVADAFQGRGIATRMLAELAAIAAGRGIRRFEAHVIADNRPMLAVFEHAGFTVERVRDGGEVTASVDITALSDEPRRSHREGGLPRRAAGCHRPGARRTGPRSPWPPRRRRGR
jgi:RimJ/RimL family protein N-acetyltransferase